MKGRTMQGTHPTVIVTRIYVRLASLESDKEHEAILTAVGRHESDQAMLADIYADLLQHYPYHNNPEDMQVPMTKRDYTFLADSMKEIMNAQEPEDQEKYRRAYDALAQMLFMSDQYKNFNVNKFRKQAGIKKD